jgi:hypothetical protein
MESWVLADVGGQILDAFGKAIAVLFAFIPALIGALVILVIGWIVAAIVKALLVRVLRAVHFDQAMDHAGVGTLMRRGGVHADAAGLLATVVFWFIFLIFVVAAANAINVPAITSILNAIVLWLPQLFVALLVVIVGMLLARVVGDIVRDALRGAGMGGAQLLAGIARAAIIAFAAIIALNQIGVGAAIVQELFAAVVFGLALAMALAFGLGGRDTAKRIVDGWYSALNSPQASQTMKQVTQSQPAQRTGDSAALQAPTSVAPAIASSVEPPDAAPRPNI